jgi:hypothetical protein
MPKLTYAAIACLTAAPRTRTVGSIGRRRTRRVNAFVNELERAA